MTRISLSVGILLLVAFLLQSCTEFVRIQKKGDLNTKLTAGVAYYKKKDYYRSSILLEEIVPLLKGRAEAEQALYYLAYDYFQQEQYQMASFYFKEFYQTYNRSEQHEECMFMYSKALFKESPIYNLDQQNTYEALKAIQSFIGRYPNSSYMTECNTMVDNLSRKIEEKDYEHARLYFKIHNYKSAVISLTSFMDQYPTSEHNEEICFIRFKSQYHLAKNSVTGKRQLERYYDAIGFYRNFVEKYPNSKYLKEANQFAKLCELDLAKLKS